MDSVYSNIVYLCFIIRDFFKKLNTLQKAIRSSQWQIPAGILMKAEKKEKNKIHSLEKHYRELLGEHAQLENMLISLQQQGQKELSGEIAKQKEVCQLRINELGKKIVASNLISIPK